MTVNHHFVMLKCLSRLSLILALYSLLPAHRAMAAVLAVALTIFSFVIRRHPDSTRGMRVAASTLLTLLVLQILLGMEIIQTFRRADVTTGHVVVGALTFAVTFWLTWRVNRDAIEGTSVT